jgi:hypothetical protein
MVTLEDLASKMSRNYARKLPRMPASYKAALERAKTHYGETPFGPTRKANYNAAMTADVAGANYEAKVKPGLEVKTVSNWKAKMAE